MKKIVLFFGIILIILIFSGIVYSTFHTRTTATVNLNCEPRLYWHNKTTSTQYITGRLNEDPPGYGSEVYVYSGSDVGIYADCLKYSPSFWTLDETLQGKLYNGSAVVKLYRRYNNNPTSVTDTFYKSIDVNVADGSLVIPSTTVVHSNYPLYQSINLLYFTVSAAGSELSIGPNWGFHKAYFELPYGSDKARYLHVTNATPVYVVTSDQPQVQNVNQVNIPGTSLTYDKTNCNKNLFWHNKTTLNTHITGNYPFSYIGKVYTTSSNTVTAYTTCLKVADGTQVEFVVYEDDAWGDSQIGNYATTVKDGVAFLDIILSYLDDEFDNEDEFYFKMRYTNGTAIAISGNDANSLIYVKETSGATKLDDGVLCITNEECNSGVCAKAVGKDVKRCKGLNYWIGECGNSASGWGCSTDKTKCIKGGSPDKMCGGDYRCNINYYTNNPECAEKKIDGTSCDLNIDCKSGSCTSGICGQEKGYGVECNSDSECYSGYCDNVLTPRVCRPSTQYNFIGNCGASYECNEGHTYCVPSSADFSVKVCSASYYCVVDSNIGSCRQKKADNIVCGQSYECISGSCVNKVCVSETLKANGQSCDNNNECDSGYCDILLDPRVCRPLPLTQNLCGQGYNCNVEHDKCVPQSVNNPIILCPTSVGIPYYCVEAGGGANCGLQKRSNGLGCKNNYECQSNSCLNKVCVVAKKLNGEDCTINSDCQSGNCENSLDPVVCRPSKIIGWPASCGQNYDCSEDGKQCNPNSKNLFDGIKICDTNNYCSVLDSDATCGNPKKEQDALCGSNYECKSNFCVTGKCGITKTCSDDSNCEQGQKCYTGFCVPEWFCESDIDCSTGQKCNPNDNHCLEDIVECQADTDCSIFGDLGICDNNVCYQQCNTDNPCPSNQKCSSVDDIGVCIIDTDGDGLSDQEETDLGTDPNDPDSDGDGANDNVDSAPNDLTTGGTPSGGTPGGGGGGGGSGGSGGGGLAAKSCVTCPENSVCSGNEIINDMACCKSCSVAYYSTLASGGSVVVDYECKDINSDGVVERFYRVCDGECEDNNSNLVTSKDVLAETGYETAEGQDGYCTTDSKTTGEQDAPSYGLLSLMFTLLILLSYYTKRFKGKH